MFDHGPVIHYLNQLHHATIFVGQNVAMVHKLAGKIGKMGSHLDLAGISVATRQRQREGVPPDPRPRQLPDFIVCLGKDGAK